jgi:membrane protease YdiL (CAAX protease family)
MHLFSLLPISGLRAEGMPSMLSLYFAKGVLAGFLALYYFLHKDQWALVAGGACSRILSWSFLGWLGLFVLFKGTLVCLHATLDGGGRASAPEALSLASSYPGVLMLVVIGPVLEEGFFRGYLLHRFLRAQSRAMSVLLSSALFAVLHFDPAALVPSFLLALFLCAVMLRTRHLGYCIVFHGLNNLAAVLAAGNLANP